MSKTDADTAANVRAALGLIDAWNAHDVRRVADFFCEDYIGDDVSIAGQFHGPRDVRRYVLYNLLGFPDLHFELNNTVAERDQVVIIWTVTGTHQGRVLNIPPTGQRVEAKGSFAVRRMPAPLAALARLYGVDTLLQGADAPADTQSGAGR